MSPSQHAGRGQVEDEIDHKLTAAGWVAQARPKMIYEGLGQAVREFTLGFLEGNLVMEYPREQAVADGVNVDFDIYRIRTEITEDGSSIDAGLVTGFRDREAPDDAVGETRGGRRLSSHRSRPQGVSEDQIRVIRTFKEKLFTEIFPGRTRVPKTLIFAKDDSHADDIVQIVREEFGKDNEFAMKITYRTEGKPEDMLSFPQQLLPPEVVTVE